MGGMKEDDKDCSTDEVFSWNEVTGEKRPLTAMPSGVCNPAVVFVEGEIYAVGKSLH